MWWRAETHDLSRVDGRISTVYLEHAVIERDGNAVVVLRADGAVHIPAAMLACVLLGPGTKVSQSAVCLLADSGTAMSWVGEQGVRMYASGTGPAQTSRLLIRQAYLVSTPRRRLGVARQMYAMRFPGEDVRGLTLQQLRGREGARVRNCYREHSIRTGVPWRSRQYIPGRPFDTGDDVNRVLSALHSCLYGVSHAAIVGLGASPALGFIHTGKAISFVLDVADLYKAGTSIPLAFDLVADGKTDERTARTRFRDLVAETNLLSRMVTDIKGLLLDPSELDLEDEQPQGRLWDTGGEVPSGRNYADDLPVTGNPAIDNLSSWDDV